MKNKVFYFILRCPLIVAIYDFDNESGVNCHEKTDKNLKGTISMLEKD